MSLITIDTNILYHLTGVMPREGDSFITDERLKSIREMSKLYVSSPTVFETVVHFRDRRDKLGQAIEPICKGEINVIDIGFCPVTDYMSKLCNGDLPQDIIEEIFKRKVEIEQSTLLFYLFMVVRTVTARWLEENRSNLSQKQFEILCMSFISLLNKSSADYFSQKIHEALLEAYSESEYGNQIQSRIKEVFEYILSGMLVAGSTFLTVAKNNIDAEDGRFIETLAKEPAFLMATNKDLLIKYLNVRPIKKDVRTDLLRLSEEFRDDARYSVIPFEYINSRFEKLFFDKGKIKKNDVFDLLVVYSLHNPEVILITFDGKLQDFLKAHHPTSWQFMKDHDLLRSPT